MENKVKLWYHLLINSLTIIELIFVDMCYVVVWSFCHFQLIMFHLTNAYYKN